jgi:hypothetical protein
MTSTTDKMKEEIDKLKQAMMAVAREGSRFVYDNMLPLHKAKTRETEEHQLKMTSTTDKMKEEIDKLKQENEKLKKEIEEYEDVEEAMMAVAREGPSFVYDNMLPLHYREFLEEDFLEEEDEEDEEDEIITIYKTLKKKYTL